MAVEGYLLGPRVHRDRVFGWMRPSQVVVLAVGAVLAVVVMMTVSLPVLFILPLSLLLGAAIFGACAALAFVPISGLLTVQWAPHWIALLVARARGRTVWETQAFHVGTALGTHGELERVESLPASLRGLRILDVAGGGIVYDAVEQTVCGALKVHLHAMGMLDQEEQRRRYKAFGDLQDELALDVDPSFRLMMLKRIASRQQNELLSYLDEMVLDKRSRHAKALYDLVGGREERDHELFVVVRCGVRQRSAAEHDRMLLRACARVRIHLERLDEALRHAGIALRTSSPVLDPGRYARLIKDQIDPFGASMRDRLAYENGRDGIDPEAAWPTHTDRSHAGFWRADSADHVAWWVTDWPTEPVEEGWLEPLMLPRSVPLLNVAVVMKPVATRVAVAEARRALVSDRSSAKTRAEIGQVHTTDEADREDQGVRHEREARKFATWRFEACLSTSVLIGEHELLEERVEDVQAACARAGLGATRMWTMQERFFLRTLPLARGLRNR